MRVKILGSGCMKCKKLYENTKKAIDGLDIDADVEKVEDMNQIISFGVMMTPALVIDGKIKCEGRVPGVDEIKGMVK